MYIWLFIKLSNIFAFQVRSSAKIAHLSKKGHKVFMSCLQMHKKQLGFVLSALASRAP